MRDRTGATLQLLADAAARSWLHAARSTNVSPDDFDLPMEDPSEVEAARKEYREREEQCRQRVDAIRSRILERDFHAALELMIDLGTPVGHLHLRFLERAFPFMTETERANCLQWIWRRSKGRSPAGALTLFRGALLLRDTVPAGWPETVSIYRGTWSLKDSPQGWRRARQRLRRGISWTTDRDVAMRFAKGDVGCIGSAKVPRREILAYFNDDDDALGALHEHECIVDPGTLTTIHYERVEPAALSMT